MALSDAVAEKARKGPPCTVCFAMERLPAEESAALVQMLSDTGWRYTQISEELHKIGWDISNHTLGHHARGHCSARVKLR